jgi:hypothetical protein
MRENIFYFKIKKLSFIKKLFLFNFYFGFRPIIILAFLTPHGSRFATNVAIVRPLSLKGRAMAPKV